ncbi:MAG TPA: DUF1353 domain-containing protein [Phenylobacterium sp.]|uniref:DUF1353 domain-containing protein n=1 Tax=Phenylobacterium sp. TaxID=1871053 RepID=UPI002B46E0EC|nr:DUF1353 domain-containing protein [Phenylobacterium sp.]HKR87006.1 DUF1353 domain-containing protein [Phenylobacterium sp.]
MTAFEGPLAVEILDKARDGRVTARLLQQFEYWPASSGEAIAVPAGFVTDFASVPWGFWNLEPPLGDAGKAAVVHDYLYATKGLGGRYSRAQADGVFRDALAALGVPLWKRTLLWAAVRVGGAGGWGS